MRISVALVHHANQYLITNGYDNREGLTAVLGSPGSGAGLAAVLEIHRQLQIPLNLHISGTLLEAIAWHQPEFLHYVRELLAEGWVELVGSCYGQNIMRFFSAEYNLQQLNEELALYESQLGIDPCQVKTFWPPERVWETKRIAPVLRDARLRNDGYRHVILDDRLLVSTRNPTLSRTEYDESRPWLPEHFQMHEIRDGLGLVAFPIATRLRRSIPPQQQEDWDLVQCELEGLLVHANETKSADLLAVFADDMEKSAGIGEWGSGGPERYRRFLEWMKSSSWIEPVRLQQWASTRTPLQASAVETGTFQELAAEFDAGEGYEKWYLAPDWAPFRRYFQMSEEQVAAARQAGGDKSLLDLADKQLLVGNWETAWHTPATGPHGDPGQHGHASPWAKALTSHVRHAALTAAAACGFSQADERAVAELADLDQDGEQELVVKNRNLFAVFSPRWGGRLVYLFAYLGERGAMVIGNPCDDWNWQEELNRYMDTPRNHPGALADVGCEHDEYSAEIVSAAGEMVTVRLTNKQRALTKEISLSVQGCALGIRYLREDAGEPLEIEFGLSPDYLTLLRQGVQPVRKYEQGSARGWSAGEVAVWVKPCAADSMEWRAPYQESFGHGRMLRLATAARECSLEIGVSRILKGEQP